jgi:hypothetical protein
LGLMHVPYINYVNVPYDIDLNVNMTLTIKPNYDKFILIYN